MTDANDELDVALGCAWYTREQWALLRAVSVDGDELDADYDSWLSYAEAKLNEQRSQGLNIQKVPIDVDELIQWCKNEAMPLNGKARAAFTTLKLREQHQ